MNEKLLTDWLAWGLFIFVFLNIIDIYFTKKIIENGGKEFNPLIRWIYNQWGYIGMSILKVLILVLFFVQYFTGTLDMWTIWYFDFAFSVILTMMYFDLKSEGVSLFTKGKE